MRRTSIVIGIAAICLTVFPHADAAAQDKLKIAVGGRGSWSDSISELAQNAGFFKKHGLDVNILYTEGSGETIPATISGSIDVGVGVGTFGLLSTYAKGAPVRVIGATMTGVNDQFWYAKAESPLRTGKDLAGKTVAYSSFGASTQAVVLGFAKVFAVDLKPVATGNIPSTYTQVMSGQVEVGWTTVPFGLKEVEQGKIRSIVRANEVPELRNQTVRLIITNVDMLQNRKDVLVRYLRAYRDTVDWLYADPAAVTAYAQLAGVSEADAKKVRDNYIGKDDIDPDRIEGLDALMADAIRFKFLTAPLSKDQLHELIQVPLE